MIEDVAVVLQIRLIGESESRKGSVHGLLERDARQSRATSIAM